MALNDVTIVRGQGGLGRALPGEDYISGMVFYTGTLPSGFSSTDRIKQVLSVTQAEALGILDDYSDETRATGTVTITVVGADGDTIAIYIQEPLEQVLIATYTKVTADSTVTLVAAAIALAINLGNPTTGYSATSALGVITITFRKGLGIFPNTGTPISTVISGTIARTLVQNVIPGVASLLAQWHYHIKEYFRLQPQGNLFVGFFAVMGAATYQFADIITMQSFAIGKIRQLAIYVANTAVYTTAAHIITACGLIQTQCNTLESQHSPLSVVLGTDLSGVADFTTLQNLGALADRSVSVVITQDGNNLGYSIYKAQGYSITMVGAVLGAISLAKVNESIAWVQKFNMTDGLELSVIRYSNGTLLNMITDSSMLNQLNVYRYLFLRYFTGYPGTFMNDNHCAIVVSSDYAYINDNRTIDKASRILYLAYLPFLSGTIKLKADGTLSDTDVAYLTDLGNDALDAMIRDGEISARGVTVDPQQNILSTNQLIVAVQIVPTGVARNIRVNIGYVLSIS